MRKKQQEIIEKKLGIPGSYQHDALNSHNFLQANWHRNKLVVLRQLLHLNKNQEILNLGIGSGNFEQEFAREVKEITGVDYNDEAIIFAKNLLKKSGVSNVKLIISDIKNIHKKIKYKKFDLILMVDVIEHLKIQDSEKTVKNLRKLLKKEGLVCVITPNYNSSWRFIEKILDKISVLPKFSGEQHLAKFYRDNLVLTFEKSDYQKEFCSTFNLFSYLLPSKPLSSLFVKLEVLSLPFGGNLLIGIFRR